jgi:glycosyltransferase involved in cell wall biosynthesis
LELALNIGTGDPSGEDDGAAVASLGSPGGITDYIDDATDLRTLRRHGWLVREAHEVAASPEAYRSYIQRSRGEFSCVKPSCIAFQNAWISDRTVCYLASGKPAIVQDTGPSSYLPRAEGLFRFSTVDEAAAALDRVQTDFARHSQAARSIAEEFFDARRIAESILNHVG